MSTSFTISLGSAIENYELQNRYETQKNIYLWGVRGNSFVLITNQDSFLKRIWSLFLAKLSIIKTDSRSIQSLRERSITKLQSSEAVKLITGIPHETQKSAAYLSFKQFQTIVESLKNQRADSESKLAKEHETAFRSQKELHTKVLQDTTSELKRITDLYENLSREKSKLETRIQHLEEQNKEQQTSLEQSTSDNNRILADLRKDLEEKGNLNEVLKSETLKAQESKQNVEKLIDVLRNQLKQKETEHSSSLKTHDQDHENVIKAEKEHFEKEKEQLLSNIYRLTKENEMLANSLPKSFLEVKDPIDIYKHQFEQWRKEHDIQIEWFAKQRDQAVKERNQLEDEVKKLRLEKEKNWAANKV